LEGPCLSIVLHLQAAGSRDVREYSGEAVDLVLMIGLLIQMVYGITDSRYVELRFEDVERGY
jgi:hypothetical protein